MNRGFAIMELLVALTIGLFLLLGITTYFSQSRQTQNLQQSLVSLQEHERVITVLFNRIVRHAGYAEAMSRTTDGRQLLFPASAPYAAGQILRGTRASANRNVNGVTLPQAFPNDTIAVRYVGDGILVGCDGTLSTAGTVHAEIISVDGEHLNCNAGAGLVNLLGLPDVPESQQVRILGLQVSYGQDADNDGIIERFDRADTVTNWADVVLADINVHIQSGAQPPQAVNVTVPFENVAGVSVL